MSLSFSLLLAAVLPSAPVPFLAPPPLAQQNVPRVVTLLEAREELASFLEQQQAVGQLVWLRGEDGVDPLSLDADVLLVDETRMSWDERRALNNRDALHALLRRDIGVVEAFGDPHRFQPPYGSDDTAELLFHPRHPATQFLSGDGWPLLADFEDRNGPPEWDLSGDLPRPLQPVDPNRAAALISRRDGEELLALSHCGRSGDRRHFVTSLGRDPRSWQEPIFQRHLLAGIRWAAVRPTPVRERVLIISVDGLRGDALQFGEELLPNLTRLSRGSSTLRATTDPDFTVTLPNHVGMVTGVPVRGPGGHRWTKNALPENGETVTSVRGEALPNIFSVAAERGVHTGLFAGKEKFVLFPDTWPDSLDDYLLHLDPGTLTKGALASLREGTQSLVLLHYRQPDVAGHAWGWRMDADSEYIKSVADVDRYIGHILREIAEDRRLRRRTAILLTADHGGGVPHKNHHGLFRSPVNAIIPFLVWIGDDLQADLYQLNPSRSISAVLDDPGTRGRQPIRNLDVAELALDLLDLPPLSPATTTLQLRWQ